MITIKGFDMVKNSDEYPGVIIGLI